METVTVSAQALHKLLIALNGPPHILREMQVCRGKMFPDNPIDVLTNEMNGAIEEHERKLEIQILGS